jgi:Ca2+-binding RTX toxin-like protein
MARKNVNPWGGTFTDDDFSNDIFGSWYDDTIFAKGGDDTVQGYEGNDKIYGGDGDDALYGGEGNDKLYGQDDDDYVNGGEGDDVVDGGEGNDRLDGGRGDDSVRGGDGDDRIFDWSPSGSDRIDGGTGHDTLIYSAFEGKTEVTLNGDAAGAARQWVKVAFFPGGPQTLVELGADEIFGIEDVIGGRGDDTITGDGNANDFYGNSGNDDLRGKGGNDVLDGSTGNDIIDGGAGYDTMTGGPDADTFVFKNGETSMIQLGFFGRTPSLIDTITDYAREDKIDLSDIDANVNLAGDQAFHISPIGRFTRTAGELQIWVDFGEDENVYRVEGDVNGDARADFMIEVHGRISGVPDFIF